MMTSQIVTTPEQLSALVDAYSRFDAFAIDTETMSGRPMWHDRDKPMLDTRTNIVFWVSLAGPGRSDVIPVGHPLGRMLRPALDVTCAQDECPDLRTCQRCSKGQRYNKDGSISKAKVRHIVPPKFGKPPEQLTHDVVFDALKPLLLGDALKIGHNIKFDAQSVAKYLGEPMAPPYADTQILAQLVNENHGPGQYGLLDCTRRELEFEYAKIGSKGVENFSFADAARYARLDALCTWLCYKSLWPKLVKEGPKLVKLFDLEMKVLEVVIDMEMTGAPINVEAMEKLEKDLNFRLRQLEKQIEEANGGPINLNADAQIRDLVYGKLGFKHNKANAERFVTEKTGLPSVSAKALEPFAKNPVVSAILEHAQVHKVYSTYIANNLPAVLETGRLYAEFDQMGARTGRFSSRNPNLQNIPARRGKEVRELFIAGEGHKLIVCDYSQVELRILAHYTQDPLLVKAYNEGFDLHSATARNAYGLKPDETPTDRQRSLAKNVNFSMVYGATAFTLVQKYEVPEKEAENLVKAFYGTYRKVKPWQEKVLKECRKSGRYKSTHGYHVDPYVETILGRKRRLPEIMWDDFKEKARAERQAINTVIQGTAADIMKLAMVRLYEEIKGTPIKMLLQVHDEIVVLTPDDMAEQAKETVQRCMEGVNMLSVPLVAEAKIAETWSEK